MVRNNAKHLADFIATPQAGEFLTLAFYHN